VLFLLTTLVSEYVRKIWIFWANKFYVVGEVGDQLWNFNKKHALNNFSLRPAKHC